MLKYIFNYDSDSDLDSYSYNNDYLILNNIEPFCMPSCKRAKRKGKKAKKEGKNAKDMVSSVASDFIEEINKASGSTENSICNIDSLPKVTDVKLLSSVIDITNNSFDNINNRINNQDLFDKYNESINFNKNYKNNLKKKENTLFKFGYGNNQYSDLNYVRDSELNNNIYNDDDNTSYLFNSDYKSIINVIQENIFINNEIFKNNEILDNNKNKLLNKKNNLEKQITNINNDVLVENRDTYYDNLENDNLNSLIYIIIYTYYFFYLLYVFQILNNPNFNYIYDTLFLILIGLLPTIIFNNIIKFIIHFF